MQGDAGLLTEQVDLLGSATVCEGQHFHMNQGEFIQRKIAPHRKTFPLVFVA